MNSKEYKKEITLLKGLSDLVGSIAGLLKTINNDNVKRVEVIKVAFILDDDMHMHKDIFVKGL